MTAGTQPSELEVGLQEKPLEALYLQLQLGAAVTHAVAGHHHLPAGAGQVVGAVVAKVIGAYHGAGAPELDIAVGNRIELGPHLQRLGAQDHRPLPGRVAGGQWTQRRAGLQHQGPVWRRWDGAAKLRIGHAGRAAGFGAPGRWHAAHQPHGQHRAPNRRRLHGPATGAARHTEAAGRLGGKSGRSRHGGGKEVRRPVKGGGARVACANMGDDPHNTGNRSGGHCSTGAAETRGS